MNEYSIVWISTLAGLGLIIASGLYSLGGRRHKWIRRFIASLVLAGTVMGTAALMNRWTPWLAGVWPCLVAGFCLGYSGDSMTEKVCRRTVYFAGVATAGIWTAIVLGSVFYTTRPWAVLPIHLVGLWSIYLGSRNPLKAAAEEFYICLLLNAGLVMYVFIK